MILLRRAYNVADTANPLGEQSPDNIPKVLSFQPTGKVLCAGLFALER